MSSFIHPSSIIHHPRTKGGGKGEGKWGPCFPIQGMASSHSFLLYKYEYEYSLLISYENYMYKRTWFQK